MKFKTTIKCSGCVSTVTPFLDAVEGINDWSVDLVSPDRILTVNGNSTDNEVIEVLKKAGFTAEKID